MSTLGLSRWERPKKKSGRKCLLCGAVPAGRAHIKVSWFRGDDVVLACCEACSRTARVGERLIEADAQKTKEMGIVQG